MKPSQLWLGPVELSTDTLRASGKGQPHHQITGWLWELRGGLERGVCSFLDSRRKVRFTKGPMEGSSGMNCACRQMHDSGDRHWELLGSGEKGCC